MICNINRWTDPWSMPEEEPWAKYDISDPAIRLLNGTARAGFFFYSRNTLILPVAGSGWQLGWKQLGNSCCNFGSAQGGLSPKNGCHSAGRVAGCGLAQVLFNKLIYAVCRWIHSHLRFFYFFFFLLSQINTGCLELGWLPWLHSLPIVSQEKHGIQRCRE